MLHTLSDSRSATMRRRMLQYVRTVPCPVCDGHRLRPESLAVTFAGHSIADLAALPLAGLAEVLRGAGGAARRGRRERRPAGRSR